MPAVDRQFDAMKGTQSDGHASAVEDFAARRLGPASAVSLPKLLLSVSVLVLAITVSFIAWEHFGRAEPVATPTEQVSQAPDTEWGVISIRLANLEEENRTFRAELDGLVGPGGVLPRIIERLQEEQRIDATHRVAIDQLFAVIAQSGALSGRQAQSIAIETGPPVSVTPVRAPQMDRPVRVIVTPKKETPTPEVRDE